MNATVNSSAWLFLGVTQSRSHPNRAFITALQEFVYWFGGVATMQCTFCDGSLDGSSVCSIKAVLGFGADVNTESESKISPKPSLLFAPTTNLCREARKDEDALQRSEESRDALQESEESSGRGAWAWLEEIDSWTAEQDIWEHRPLWQARKHSAQFNASFDTIQVAPVPWGLLRWWRRLSPYQKGTGMANCIWISSAKLLCTDTQQDWGHIPSRIVTSTHRVRVRELHHRIF